MEVADECDDPNAIHLWNRFKCEVIKKPGGGGVGSAGSFIAYIASISATFFCII